MTEPTAPAREPLTRERSFAAALEIIDTEGLPALSMRRLGSALEVEAMAIYYHVPNKNALLAGVGDLLLSAGHGMPGGVGWRQGLHWEADTLRASLIAHPAAVPIVMDAPLRTEYSARLVDRPLVLLTEAGFSPDDATRLFRATLALLFGWITLEGASLRRGEAAGDIPADVPTAARLGPLVSDWSGGFDEALDALLDTWARRLPPGAKGTARTPGTARPAATSAWIVEKGGDGDKGHKKGKGAKKKGKGKKKP